jgi:hypothetical protein
LTIPCWFWSWDVSVSRWTSSVLSSFTVSQKSYTARGYRN